jgi:uncharacterized protein YegP (UPF0339 family)
MYFFVYRDAARLWRWRLQAGDARVMHQSEARYAQKSECVAAVQAFRESVEHAAIIDEGKASVQAATTE